MKKYKIINKTRFFLFITFLFIIAALIITFFTNSIKAHSMILNEEYEEIQIVEGDTLWKLALEYMPSKYDVRDMVYKIKEFNNMETSYIYPGDILKIPVINK